MLIDTSNHEVVLKDLPMPHSPRWFDGQLYLLLSATGELVQVDIERQSYQVIKSLNGFIRGMAKHGDYLFIGTSKLRENSSTFKHLEIAKLANKASVIVMHLPTQSIVAEMVYHNSVDEIYDIQIIPDKRRPGILNTEGDIHKQALSLPRATFWARGL